MNVAERVHSARPGTALLVRCLGRFRLEDLAGDHPLIRTRKARALVAALAVSGRPLSREAIADLLWSDRAPAQARSSARQTIFELQHLASGESAILAVSREEVSLRPELVATDIELIRSAAADGDWPRLLVLLEGSEPGLLTDLDGLDSEFDDWLRLARASEPSKTLSAAVAAAERCLDEAGPRAASDLVGEILRLDPANEEAVRLALRIDHRLGDSGALHRHYASLRDRLRDDFGAEPSPETSALFNRLAGATAPAADSPLAHEAPQARLRPAISRRMLAVAALALLLVAAAAVWALLARGDAPAGRPGDPVLLAVLPFEQQPAGDSFLAEGLWDDTRAALSQNSGLRVLGRTTTRAMAERGLDPRQYRRRLAVDYLLEGSVRRIGDQVRVTVDLTRTSDGVAIWHSAFEGRLGDPMALQGAVASAIEGRLRGRLARGGGRRAEQIATSPEVYALYSEARSLLRQRDTDEAERADRLLRRAVALDPNFAPAWASLASAAHFRRPSPMRHALPREQAMTYVRHAIELAPNLAEAHATLALIAGPSARQSEPALKRALALDPNNAEAWNWLGNVRMKQFRVRDALPAYGRAVEIDPLFSPAAQNLVEVLADSGDLRGARQVQARLERAGAGRDLLAATRSLTLVSMGDYSAAAAQLLTLASERRTRSLNFDNFAVGDVLLRLGYFDEAAEAWKLPAWMGPVLRGERAPPDELIADDPASFWHNDYHPAYAGRALVNLGQGERLVSLYRAEFRTPADFVEAAIEYGILETSGPTLSVALRDSGDAASADVLAASTAQYLERLRRNAPDNRELLWQLGMARAAQGRTREALALLTEAADRGWLPDGLTLALDIAQEPALRGLRGDPRFEALRKRILAHIARERAELGPVRF